MARPRYTAKGAEALFGAALTYSFSGVLVREMGLMWGDKAQVAARWTIAFIFLMVYGYFRKSDARVPRAKLPDAIALGFVYILLVLFFTLSVQRTTIANALFIFYAVNLV